MKDEISSSLNTSDIFVLISLWMCYFRAENFKRNLCKLIVCGSQALRSTQQTQRAEILLEKGMPTDE